MNRTVLRFIEWIVLSILLAPLASTSHATLIGQERDGMSCSYKVWRTTHAAANKPQVVVIFISIEPRCFTDEQMSALARELNQNFRHEQRLRAIILDDEYAARKTSPIHRKEEYLAARRGIYFIDRNADEEYIMFSNARGRPIYEVKIVLGQNKN